MTDFTKQSPSPSTTSSEKIKQLSDGALCDVAPTILALLQLEQPTEMTGKSLLN